jgi:hypothetical protein
VGVSVLKKKFTCPSLLRIAALYLNVTVGMNFVFFLHENTPGNCKYLKIINIIWAGRGVGVSVLKISLPAHSCIPRSS